MLGGNFGILLQTFGICFLVVALIFIITYTADFLGNKVEKIIYIRKVKHRFKKKPITKCYCIDCFYYKDNCKTNRTGQCLRLEKIVADDGFCKDAFPYREDD